MKNFEIDPAAVAEIRAAQIALHDLCEKHGAPMVSIFTAGVTKTIEATGISVEANNYASVFLNGPDKVTNEMAAINAFTDGEARGMAHLAEALFMQREYGALLLEDNAIEACEHFAEHGDQDAARRVGGSLPPL